MTHANPPGPFTHAHGHIPGCARGRCIRLPFSGPHTAGWRAPAANDWPPGLCNCPQQPQLYLTQPGKGLRPPGSQMGPGGPVQGYRRESVVVTAGAGRGGPGTGPAGTFAAGWGAPGEAGGGRQAALGAKGVWGWGVTAEACRPGSSLEGVAGSALCPGGAVSATAVVQGLTVKVWGNWA